MDRLKRGAVRIRKSLTLQMAFAVTLASFLGFYYPEYSQFQVFSSFGQSIIQLIKTFATPLLFFVVLHALVTSEVTSRLAFRMLKVAFTNGSIALGIGLVLSHVFQPGKYVPLGVDGGEVPSNVKGIEALSVSGILENIVPKSILEPFVSNSVIGVVVVAVLVGLALRQYRNRTVDDFLVAGVKTCEVLLSWIVRLAPLAVFSVTYRLIGDRGLSAFKGLSIYLMVGLLGFLLHVGITYHFWIKLILRRSLRAFWREASEPVVYAFGANSSLATLPLTLRALKRLNVSDGSAALGACVGTNLNNDGILLYEAMSVLMVAQAQGVDWDLLTQLGAAVVCMVAAMGVAGVPEAGFISLTVVVATLGLPTESLPILLSVDWILARARSSVNVLSDMVVSMVIDGREHDRRVSG